MPFCIPEEEYDEELHEIVSGPHDTCTDCSAIGLGGSLADFGSFFEIPSPPEPFGIMSSSSLLIRTQDFNTHSFAINVIQKNLGGIYTRCRVFLKPSYYNKPWNLDIELNGFFGILDVVEERLDLSPSTIEQMLSDGLAEDGSDFYFLFSGKAKQVEFSGLIFCDKPLSISLNRVIGQSGSIGLEGRCEGDCTGKTDDGLSGYCPEYESEQLMSRIEDEERRSDEMVEEEGVTIEEVIEYLWYEELSDEEKEEYTLSENQYNDNLKETDYVNDDYDYDEINYEDLN